MTVSSDVSPEQNEITIHVSGRFDFSAHHDFQHSYTKYAKGEKKFVVDLQDVDYMDSSAMGMLLQLREHSNKEAGGVVLANGSDGIREILRIANFDKLFTLG